MDTIDAMRGKIRNRAYASQIRDFSGLKFGTITPTDVDGFIEVNNKTFIFMESKYRNSQLPYGQRLALERLVDVCYEAGKDAILFILVHESSGDIDFAACQVSAYRYEKQWVDVDEPITAKDAVYGFIENSKEKQKKNL